VLVVNILVVLFVLRILLENRRERRELEGNAANPRNG
jgi:uncharacterized membrane protein